VTPSTATGDQIFLPHEPYVLYSLLSYPEPHLLLLPLLTYLVPHLILRIRYSPRCSAQQATTQRRRGSHGRLAVAPCLSDYSGFLDEAVLNLDDGGFLNGLRYASSQEKVGLDLVEEVALVLHLGVVVCDLDDGDFLDGLCYPSSQEEVTRNYLGLLIVFTLTWASSSCSRRPPVVLLDHSI
jgi:hypothetical protein